MELRVCSNGTEPLRSYIQEELSSDLYAWFSRHLLFISSWSTDPTLYISRKERLDGIDRVAASSFIFMTAI